MLQSYCIQGFKSIKNATEVDLKKQTSAMES